MTNLIVPKEMDHSFFFPQRNFDIELEELQTFQAKSPFIHEIAFYSGYETVKPWQNPEKYIPQLQAEWKRLLEEITGLFQKRDKENILIPMKQGIGFLFENIFWSNGLPVILVKDYDLNTLSLKPVNLSERIQFLLARPTIYPSFIQLIELMEEQEKQFSKYLATKSIYKNNS
jgi:hypothetical protein